MHLSWFVLAIDTASLQAVLHVGLENKFTLEELYFSSKIKKILQVQAQDPAKLAWKYKMLSINGNQLLD